MFQKFLKAFLLPILILVFVLFSQYGEIKFQTSDPVVITPEMAQSFRNLNFDQYYEIDKKMLFKIQVQSEDKATMATLLWPGEPFTRILVLASYSSDELDTQDVFRGRLVDCIYKCAPNGLGIEIQTFADLIAKKFPEFKHRNAPLPQAILNMADKPTGLAAYLKVHYLLTGLVGVAFTVGLGFFVKLCFSKD